MLELPYSDSLANELKNGKHVAVYSSQDSNLLIVGRLGESTDNDTVNLRRVIPGIAAKVIYLSLIFMNVIILVKCIVLITIR